MIARPRPAALFALMMACVIASGASAAPMPVDSLMTESLRHARLAAPDLNQLSWLRREADYAARQFGRALGNDPPLISVASVVTLPEARRPSVAALRVAGYEFVLGEPTDLPGPGPVTADDALAWSAPGSERMARWYVRALVRQNATGTPPPGRTSPVPDWYESAVAGLATLPTEQNRRIAWMHARMDEHIPIEQFLTMTRPEATAKPRKASAKAPAVYSQRLFDAQSLSFARFLSLAESERFIGKTMERAMTGESQLYAFNIAKRLLPRPDALDTAWVEWVKAGAGRFGPR